jgi:CheY-like chemotaxis protein
LIYVVDDEPMLLELASAILEPLGYRIQTFRDPGEALQAFKAAKPPPVLVITDYAMQQMTGAELMEACRKFRPEQKVLLVSGTVGPEIFGAATDKPNRFLTKPYKPKQLIDLVEALLAE